VVAKKTKKVSNESYKIIKMILLVYLLTVIVNIMIFMVSEYEHTRRELLKDFRIMANSVSYPLAEVLWRNNSREIENIVSSILENPYTTGLRIEDEERNIVIEKIKNNSYERLRTKYEIVYKYERRKLKVGDLYIYTNYLKVVKKMENSLFIIIIGSFVESIIIVFLVFWGFRNLITFFIKEIERRNKNLVNINYSFFNSIAFLESNLKYGIAKLFKLTSENSNLDDEIASRNQEIESLKQQLEKHNEEEVQMRKLFTPNRDLIKRFFNDIFIDWIPKTEISGDAYILMEIGQSEELVFLMVDYNGSVKHSLLSILLREIEQDIFNSQNSIGKILGTNKILNFADQKIQKKLRNIGVKLSEETQFRGFAFNYKVKEKVLRYSSLNTAFYYIKNEKLIIPDSDSASAYKASDGNYMLKEYSISVEEPTQLYIMSDGFYRQTGGEKGAEEFGKDKVKELLQSINKMPFLSQEKEILDSFFKYQNTSPQVDDVTVIGIKID
jgi:flagellar basal body-associated protein FliL